MTSQEVSREQGSHDVELPGACVCCGGPIAVRFTAGSARGVCLACRRVADLQAVRTADGVQVVLRAAGDA